MKCWQECIENHTHKLIDNPTKQDIYLREESIFERGEGMTDEEKLAEEYVKSVIDVNAFDWKIVREIGLAFLTELKAGRPKWHKVADGDLPKNENRVLLYFDFNDYDSGQFIRGRFWCACCGWFDVEEVIAWCEIPQYTEE